MYWEKTQGNNKGLIVIPMSLCSKRAPSGDWEPSQTSGGEFI